MAGPLYGIRIIEMAGLGPGPFCGMMLADMGADVICIERKPTAPQSEFDKMKRTVTDRGRRSIALDMKKEGAAELALRLIENADALIEGFRPGVMERLGLGPDICLARNPRLIYGRMTGWGQDGPLAHTAGHDINYIAISGVLGAMGYVDRPPTPPLHLVGDMGGGGMMLAFGIVCALLEAKASGQGQVIDAAISDGTATLASMYYGMRAKGQWSTQRTDNLLDGGAPFYGCYECADGRHIAIGAIEPQFYRLLLELCGINDPAFAEQWHKQAWPELREKLRKLFRLRRQDEWCALFDGTDACFTPVLDFDQALEHPHHQARNTFTRIDGIPQPAPAPRFSRTPGSAGRLPESAGQHTQEVLLEAGLSCSELANLAATGVI
ncbi:CoA transferase [Pseudomonas putida]|jgi:alpha-methylacyl-CoA racemase|uniref:CaiB/BaiF CoA transferase family protein n=1 Tax=Pseudomonas putida TaxID=303 RepID=UPI00265FB95C|nr:CaiB/BaiF CoA-transferase family protein [Pseudomonas putida]MDO1496538.1 CoA transferase [Pseudomonas putida]